MVAQLERSRVVQRADIAAAMRAVQRHRFLPNVGLEEAYEDRAIALKSTGDAILSSISQPAMVALMLELLSPAPGDRVLEVGTGSGYNAALIAKLVGPRGSLRSIELDEELAARAGVTLAEAGCANITVAAGDGASAIARGETFDRIVVTARSDDIVAAWWDSLVIGGRIVLPLRIEGAGEFAIGFERVEDRLQSIGVYPCAFIALRGDAAVSHSSEIFYRQASDESRLPVRLRRVASVVAIRREKATPNILGEADIVVARPITLFAVTFA